jgi:glyoxylase-like metal-dependent hydrolase (beta-lactamase superfamily II)
MEETTVSLLDRGTIEADLNFVLDGDVVATASDPNPDLDYGEFLVWNLVVDHPEATVLWDTGSHPEAGEGYWPAPLYEAFAHVDAAERDLETALSGAGYALSDVDAVVMSHLHLDHAGGLYHFEGTDVPVYVHRRELEFAYLSAKTDAGSVAYWAPDFDRDLNWQVVEGDRQLYEGFDLLHLPGHTPGLLGATIEAGDETVLVAGDEAYMEANYEAGRSMAASLLWDNRAWYESLQRLRDIERRTGADVLLGHDPAMGERFGDGWNRGYGPELTTPRG